MASATTPTTEDTVGDGILTAKVPLPLLAKLRAQARARGTSLSAEARRVLSEALAEPPDAVFRTTDGTER